MKKVPDCIKRTLGFTIPETAIVVAIVAVVCMSIWAASSSLAMKHDTIEADNDLQVILVAYASMFASQQGINTGPGLPDITCMGLGSHFIPGDMLEVGTTCENNTPEPPLSTPWCSAKSPDICFNVRADQARQGIMISYWNLPKAACVQLASSQAHVAILIQSFVGNTDAPNTLVYPPYGKDIPMSLLQISEYCAHAGNEVSFEYAIR